MKLGNNSLALNTDEIRNRIHTIRGMQVMLDSDLAGLYNAETKALNQAVRRNITRFPQEFMFQLTQEEFDSLRLQIVTLNKGEAHERINNLKSQFATSNKASGTKSEFNNLKSQIVTSRWGGKRKLPCVFTEQGVAMLSGVLKSDIAIKMSIQIISAFVAMRRFISANAQIFQRLDFVEKKQVEHDKKFDEIFDAIQSRDIQNAICGICANFILNSEK
ncbi:MAG: ORF6N domain-containing protein [Nanoarchaeota archaeon]|nr:ORF6N domain-containing protein [Nanoarchaeota archaeon]